MSLEKKCLFLWLNTRVRLISVCLVSVLLNVKLFFLILKLHSDVNMMCGFATNMIRGDYIFTPRFQFIPTLKY